MKRFRKVKEDKGASNTISFIVIMFFVMILLVSFIDVGIYFNVKNEMRSAAEAGARNVALYGSTEANTGLRDFRDNTLPEEIVIRSINDNYIAGGNGQSTSKVVTVNPNNIKCEVQNGGTLAEKAGDHVWCTVKYKYKGIAGDYGLLQLGGNDVTVKGSAVSEVGK